MHCIRVFLAISLSGALASTVLAQITPGNLLVSRVGDGATALSSTSAPRFLDEYTPAGVFVQTIALPTAANGSNQPFTDSGSATSNGFVSQSVDGRFIVTAGYATAPGTASVTSSTSVAVNRVVGRIGLDGSVDTSTALTDAYSGNNFRSVASVDGSAFWTGGTGSGATPGARHVAGLGATTSTQLSTTVTNLRVVNVFDGQLYTSSASGAFLGISTVGTGLPTASGETITLLPGFSAVASLSSYDFFFADASTLYVADDRTNGNGGIQKWTLSAGTWSLAYTLAPNATTGCRGLSGTVENGVVTLYATTAVSSASLTTVVSVVDTGAASPFTTLVTNATNTALRDVLFVRTPASLTFSGTGCPTSVGTPVIGTSGAPVAGTTSSAITASNVPAATFVLFPLMVGAPLPFGVPVPGTPPCVLVYVLPDALPGTIADGLGFASTPLPIPANASLGGAVLGAQVAAFDLSLVGFDLPIGTSDALQIVIGN